MCERCVTHDIYTVIDLSHTTDVYTVPMCHTHERCVEVCHTRHLHSDRYVTHDRRLQSERCVRGVSHTTSTQWYVHSDVWVMCERCVRDVWEVCERCVTHDIYTVIDLSHTTDVYTVPMCHTHERCVEVCHTRHIHSERSVTHDRRLHSERCVTHTHTSDVSHTTSTQGAVLSEIWEMCHTLCVTHDRRLHRGTCVRHASHTTSTQGYVHSELCEMCHERHLRN